MRRTIALICDNIASVALMDFYRGLKQEAIVQNCRLLIYIGRSANTPILGDSFHNLTFDHIDDQNFDAAIVVGAAFTSWQEHSVGENKLRSLSSKPVIVTSYVMEHLSCITIDNYQAIFDLVGHLNQQHNHQRIAFVSGPSNNQESNLRFKAYQDALIDLGLEFEPKYQYQGDFGSLSGAQAIQYFQNLGQGPTAIMFANDDMAVAAMDYIYCHAPWLQNRWAITGFDDHILAKTSQLTTVSQPFAKMAKAALLQALAEIEDPSAKQTIEIPSELVFRGSCGCSSQVQTTLPVVSVYNTIKLIHQNLQSFDLDILFTQLNEFLKHLQVRGCYITRYVQEPHSDALDKAQLLFANQNYQQLSIDNQQIFSCKELLPVQMLKKLNTDVLVVQNLFFDKTHFGYLILDISDGAEEAVDMLRGHISHCIMGAHLLAQRDSAQLRLEDLTKQLQQQSVHLIEQSTRDELTGVLNRRGAKEHWRINVEQMIGGEFVDVYCTDLNDLKLINDNHGHQAGDKAINAIAQILVQLVSKDSIVCRLGGDEFLIVEFSSNENAHVLFKSRFSQLIQMRNCELTMPFYIEAELGHVRSDDLSDLDLLIDAADHELYNEKRLSKERAQQKF